MIPFKNRFHGHGSLRYVYKNGQTDRSRLMTIKFIQNPRRQDSRAAVVVGKKVLKSAVSRNRIRRRLYEALRLKIYNLREPFDIVIIVTSSELLTISFKEIIQHIDNVFQKFGLYKT
jgi:ribonuclease P protein component